MAKSMDDKGNRVKEAGPSTPVEILGLNDVPNAGEVFVALQNEKEARSFAETFITEGKNKLIEDTKAKLSLDDLFSQIKAGNVKELPIIVKADVQGSVEAVKQSLVKLSNEEVVVKVIHVGFVDGADAAVDHLYHHFFVGEILVKFFVSIVNSSPNLDPSYKSSVPVNFISPVK